MNIFKQFYKSLFSPKDIATFRFQGIGKTILYVFFLSLIAMIPSFYYFSTGVTNAVQAVANTIEDDFPDFTIEDGVLTSNQKEPLKIDKGNITIVFDSTGEITPEDLNKNEETLAILKNELVLMTSEVAEPFSYQNLTGMTITKENVQETVGALNSSLIIIHPILFLIMYVITSGVDFLEITILALMGLILKNSFGLNLKYGHLWRLTAYCVTLPTVFFMVMSSLQTNVPFGLLIHWGITIVFLYLTLKEIPKPKSKQM